MANIGLCQQDRGIAVQSRTRTTGWPRTRLLQPRPRPPRDRRPRLRRYEPIELPQLCDKDKVPAFHEGVWHQVDFTRGVRVISISGRALRADAEKHYNVVKGELLAAEHAAAQERGLLMGRAFTLQLDSTAAIGIIQGGAAAYTGGDLVVARCALALNMFPLQCAAIPGHLNFVDFFSRAPSQAAPQGNLDPDLPLPEVTGAAAIALPAVSVPPELPARASHVATVAAAVEEERGVVEMMATPEFVFERGVWRRVLVNGDRPMVVPHALQGAMLLELHAGHTAAVEMMRRATTLVWWEALARDVRTMASACEACDAMRASRTSPASGRLVERESAPGDILMVDYSGPYTVGTGYSQVYVLSLMDMASGMYMAGVFKSKEAKHVVSFLRRQWIPVMGAPSVLLGDEGVTGAACVRALEQAMGIAVHTNAPYTPEGRAVLERRHFTQNMLLAKMISKDLHERRLSREAFEDALGDVVAAMNTEVGVRGQSPLQLWTGRAPGLPTVKMVGAAPPTPVTTAQAAANEARLARADRDAVDGATWQPELGDLVRCERQVHDQKLVRMAMANEGKFEVVRTDGLRVWLRVPGYPGMAPFVVALRRCRPVRADVGRVPTLPPPGHPLADAVSGVAHRVYGEACGESLPQGVGPRRLRQARASESAAAEARARGASEEEAERAAQAAALAIEEEPESVSAAGAAAEAAERVLELPEEVEVEEEQEVLDASSVEEAYEEAHTERSLEALADLVESVSILVDAVEYNEDKTAKQIAAAARHMETTLPALPKKPIELGRMWRRAFSGDCGDRDQILARLRAVAGAGTSSVRIAGALGIPVQFADGTEMSTIRAINQIIDKRLN